MTPALGLDGTVGDSMHLRVTTNAKNASKHCDRRIVLTLLYNFVEVNSACPQFEGDRRIVAPRGKKLAEDLAALF